MCVWPHPSQIKRGEILATIDHSTGMVSFQQEMEESFDSHLSMMRLNREFQRVAKLAATVQTFDEQISTSKEYVKKVIDWLIDWIDWLMSSASCSRDIVARLVCPDIINFSVTHQIILKDQSGGMSIADSKMSDMDY